MTLKKTIHIYIVVSLALMLTGCSVTKFIPENEYLLNKVKLESEDKSLDLSAYEPYIKQRGKMVLITKNTACHLLTCRKRLNKMDKQDLKEHR